MALSHYKDKQSFTYKYPGLTPLNVKFSCTPKHDNFLARLTCKYSQLQGVASHSLGFSHFAVASAQIGK